MSDSKITPLMMEQRHIFDSLTMAIESIYSQQLILQGANVVLYDHCAVLCDQYFKLVINRYCLGLQLNVMSPDGANKVWWHAICPERASLPTYFETQRRDLPEALQRQELDLAVVLLSPALLLLIQAQLHLYRSWFGDPPGMVNTLKVPTPKADILAFKQRRAE